MICIGILPDDGSVCGRKGVRAKGLCPTCYNRSRGQPTPEEIRKVHKVNDAIDMVAARMLDAESPLLTLEDMEGIAQAAADTPPSRVQLGLPEEGEAPGIKKARGYLLSQAAYFRRKIIRQMMGNGLTESNDIFLSFFRDPELRKRWVEPLVDPWRIFRADIIAINAERAKPVAKTTKLNLRIERLENQYRVAMTLANDPKGKADLRLKALEAADRIQAKLDTLTRTIKPLPGRGEGAAPDDDDEDNEYEAREDGEEEDDDDRKYHLPVIT